MKTLTDEEAVTVAMVLDGWNAVVPRDQWTDHNRDLARLADRLGAVRGES